MVKTPLVAASIYLPFRSLENREGITFMCTGSALHLRLMHNAILSAKRFGIPIAVVSDVKPDISVDTYIPIDSFTDSGFIRKSRYYKTQFYKFAPFKSGWFIDPDVLVLKKLPSVSRVLKGGSIGLALEELQKPILKDHLLNFEESNLGGWLTHKDLEQTIRIVDAAPKELPHFNTGVIAYKKSQVLQRLCDHWYADWNKLQEGDQLAFWRIIATLGIVPSILDKTYNYCLFQWSNFEKIQTIDAYIVHCKGPWPKKQQFAEWAEDAGFL